VLKPIDIVGFIADSVEVADFLKSTNPSTQQLHKITLTHFRNRLKVDPEARIYIDITTPAFDALFLRMIFQSVSNRVIEELTNIRNRLVNKGECFYLYFPTSFFPRFACGQED
jgi:hypothetical protein